LLRLWCALAVTLLLLACEGRQPLPVYSVPPDVQSTGSQLVGRLAFDEATGCVELITSSGERVALYWPAGYSVSFSPVRIYDERGTLKATGGDRVYLGGDDIVDGRHPLCPHEWAFRITGITDSDPINPQ
jgi:hypothetical protein